MGWQDVTPSDEVDAADWIPGRLNGFAKNVGSIVPNGFEAYARIFHPGTERPNEREAPTVEVRWADVAARSGKIAHPEMQFHAIAPPQVDRWYGLEPGVFEPRLGVLSLRQAGALVELLSQHTATPNACWLCLWEGYGYLHPGGARWLVSAPRSMRWRRLRLWWLRLSLRRRRRYPRAGPRVQLPGRAYLLFKGSVVQARGWEDGPNLWWPEDRAWCVASEIDFPYTYVGGSKALIDDILRHPDLEALPATVEDGVNANSDTINS
jgi:hypothetical protein